jgi:hypothetical protein
MSQVKELDVTPGQEAVADFTGTGPQGREYQSAYEPADVPRNDLERGPRYPAATAPATTGRPAGAFAPGEVGTGVGTPPARPVPTLPGIGTLPSAGTDTGVVPGTNPGPGTSGSVGLGATGTGGLGTGRAGQGAGSTGSTGNTGSGPSGPRGGGTGTGSPGGTGR